ncbi:MAG: hypothetical protein KDN20_16185 [Verrucomicrobiae bacterium]|nr:hypothetical protein [Verrucomicrobiae bacterium]
MKTKLRALVVLSLFCVGPAFADDGLPSQLAALKKSYDGEVVRSLETTQAKYIEALESLLRSYTSAQNLEAALATKNEIEKAQRWEGLPLEELKSRAFQNMSKDDFGRWLQTKTFSFDGAAKVTLSFDGDIAFWNAGGNAIEFPFSVTSKRRLTIKGKEKGKEDYKIEFSDDLQSGTVESSRGKYDLLIESSK